MMVMNESSAADIGLIAVAVISCFGMLLYLNVAFTGQAPLWNCAG